MKYNRFLLVAVSILMVSALLVGCAGPATPAAQQTQPPAAEQPTAPAAEQPTAPAAEQPTAPAAGGAPVVVQYWSNGWIPGSIDARKAMVDKFNAEHKGQIEVQYIQGDWAVGDQYIQNGIAAGGGIACIMEWYADGALDWYRKGYVQDLRPYITPEVRGMMDEPQWQARTADDGSVVMNGTVMGYPQVVILYNPDKLKAAGIEPATIENPWTWDQMYENAKKLTVDKNGKHLGEDGFDKDNVTTYGLVERLDNEKVLEYGLQIAQNRMGKPVIRQENGKWGWFLDDNAAADYEKFLSTITAGISPAASNGMTSDTQEQMVADGSAAMIMRETFAIPTIHDHYPDANIAIMPLPADKGETWYYQADGEGMVMTKTCDHPKEAAEFMTWLMKPENDAAYAYGNSMPPQNPQSLNLEPFKSDPNWDIIRNYIANGKVFVTPFNPNYPEFRDTIASPTLMDVVAGKSTFADANKLLAEQADQVLNK
jgi:multiple sugar transport system substrate-binding protein